MGEQQRDGGMGASAGAAGGMHPGQGGQTPGDMEAAQGMHGSHHAPHSPQQGFPPYWPGYGYAVPPMPGYLPGMEQQAQRPGGAGNGMAQVMREIASGGDGLSSLSKLLDFDDKDFWKGALVGAAAVLLLSNEGVKRVLFRGAVKGRDAVQDGVEKVKNGADKVTRKARAAKEKSDE